MCFYLQAACLSPLPTKPAAHASKCVMARRPAQHQHLGTPAPATTSPCCAPCTAPAPSLPCDCCTHQTPACRHVCCSSATPVIFDTLCGLCLVTWFHTRSCWVSSAAGGPRSSLRPMHTAWAAGSQPTPNKPNGYSYWQVHWGSQQWLGHLMWYCVINLVLQVSHLCHQGQCMSTWCRYSLLFSFSHFILPPF